MREEQTFAQDCAEILREDLVAGRIDRRTFMKGLLALGLLPAALGGSGAFARAAMAQTAKPKEVVLANFGGDAVPAFTDAFAKPFEALGKGASDDDLLDALHIAVEAAGCGPGLEKAKVADKNRARAFAKA